MRTGYQYATLDRSSSRSTASPHVVLAELDRIQAAMVRQHGQTFTRAFFERHSWRVDTDGALRPYERSAEDLADGARVRRGGGSVRAGLAYMHTLNDRITTADHDATAERIARLRRRYPIPTFTR